MIGERSELVHLANEASFNAGDLSETLNLTDAPRSLKERAERAWMEAHDLSDAVRKWETKTRSDQHQ